MRKFLLIAKANPCPFCCQLFLEYILWQQRYGRNQIRSARTAPQELPTFLWRTGRISGGDLDAVGRPELAGLSTHELSPSPWPRWLCGATSHFSAYLLRRGSCRQVASLAPAHCNPDTVCYPGLHSGAAHPYGSHSRLA